MSIFSGRRLCDVTPALIDLISGSSPAGSRSTIAIFLMVRSSRVLHLIRTFIPAADRQLVYDLALIGDVLAEDLNPVIARLRLFKVVTGRCKLVKQRHRISVLDIHTRRIPLNTRRLEACRRSGLSSTADFSSSNSVNSGPRFAAEGTASR